MKQLPIAKIEQGVESVTFHCPGNQQFVVIPEDVAKIKVLSPRAQQHVVKDHTTFTVYLRPHWIARLSAWADLLMQEKVGALQGTEGR